MLSSHQNLTEDGNDLFCNMRARIFILYETDVIELWPPGQHARQRVNELNEIKVSATDFVFSDSSRKLSRAVLARGSCTASFTSISNSTLAPTSRNHEILLDSVSCRVVELFCRPVH